MILQFEIDCGPKIGVVLTSIKLDYNKSFKIGKCVN